MNRYKNLALAGYWAVFIGLVLLKVFNVMESAWPDVAGGLAVGVALGLLYRYEGPPAVRLWCACGAKVMARSTTPLTDEQVTAYGEIVKDFHINHSREGCSVSFRAARLHADVARQIASGKVDVT